MTSRQEPACQARGGQNQYLKRTLALANGISNKLIELGQLLDKHNIKVAAVQERKLSKDPSIPHFTTMHQDRQQGQGGRLLFFNHESVNFSKATKPTPIAPDPHLEAQSVTIQLKNLDLLITNVYIPPASSCTNSYQASIDHLLTGDDALVLGDQCPPRTLVFNNNRCLRQQGG